MTKDVFISIRGLQNGPQTDEEPLELITVGEYFYKNGKHYLLYEEAVEGETKTIKSRIKITPERVELTKNGVVTVQMCFEEHKKHTTQYHTPYGSLSMGIDTEKLKIEESENEMNISIRYALEMNEEFVADCKIQIKVKSKQMGEFHLI